MRMKIWDSGLDRDCDRGRFTAHAVYHQIQDVLGLKARYHLVEAACREACLDRLHTISKVRRVQGEFIS